VQAIILKFGVRKFGRGTGKSYRKVDKNKLPMFLTAYHHTPVLLPEVIKYLNIIKGEKYIDATIGGGGYTDYILQHNAIVLGIDYDKETIEYLHRKYGDRVNKSIFLKHGNFADLKKIADQYNFDDARGIIFDLGMSSYHIDSSNRGFSFNKDEPLDLRYNLHGSSLKASQIINNCTKGELYEIFCKYAEELNSRAIVEAVFRARTINGVINTSKELSGIIEKALLQNTIKRHDKYNSVGKVKARIFQGLRIAVNDEISNIQKALCQLTAVMQKDARVVILSYHSLEDRLVKKFFLKEEKNRNLKIINTKPIIAPYLEIKRNPRAKSAKLRVAQMY
jgi:16S rRNA (cytosine1402-N4)-methyltransferase